MNKEIEQQIHDFANAMYQFGKDDGYKKGIEDTKAQLQRAYENGYADDNNANLIDEAYQEGLNDVWKCFKRIAYPICDGGLSADELYEIFRTSHISHILRNYSPYEAIQKIKDYEEKQNQADAEISVGDEVMVNDIERKAIVIGISTFDDWDAPYNILFDNGNTDWVRKDIISKTGKHYSQIAEVLKGLRGENNADSN